MKLTKLQLQRLIRESLKSAHFGIRDPEGKLTFDSKVDDLESVYGKNIGSHVSKNQLEEFFKDAIVPFNIIVLPDNVFKTLLGFFGNDEVQFEQIEKNVFFRALSSLSAMARGRYGDLELVRSKIDPNAYNIIIERQDKNYGGFLMDLSWITHDLVGHGINFDGVGDYGQIVSSLSGIFNTVFHLPVPSQFGPGTRFDQDLKIDDNRIFGSAEDDTVISAIKADLESENFTPGVLDADISASVLGYYFIKGRFPSIIYDLAAEGTLDISDINKYESDFKNMVQDLKGKVGMFRFGDSV